MNKILEKFIKKIEKIKKFGIIYQDDEQVLFSIPIEIEISVSYINKTSFQAPISMEKKSIASLYLCTTSKSPTPMQKICNKNNIPTKIIICADKPVEELEKFYTMAAIHHYDLYTKRGDGHI